MMRLHCHAKPCNPTRLGKPSFLVFSLFAFLLGHSPLLADSIRLKDGSSFENVKTQLGPKQIEIQTIDGKIYVYPSDQIAEIIYKPVDWPEKKEAIEVEKSETEKNEKIVDSEKTKDIDSSPIQKHILATNDCGWNSPFLEGFIPTWSNHFCQGNYITGASFSALEGITLVNLIREQRPATQASSDINYIMNGLVLSSFAPDDRQRGGALLSWILRGSGLVYPYNERTPIPAPELDRRRLIAGGLFIGVLFLDGASAWWTSPNEESSFFIDSQISANQYTYKVDTYYRTGWTIRF